jgi:hypothetical protein
MTPVKLLDSGDLAKLDELVEVANKHFDGHLTIMKFTTNWRVSFGTPESRDDIGAMPRGGTFDEAAKLALVRPAR